MWGKWQLEKDYASVYWKLFIFA